ncbi:N-acetyltransferase [Ectobacillus sp. JY-23]|uniref:GNAT family N-acetyltransferase n=1 Tax=Ectobacillus sp. JY-23 TaxID=2933872 RepID=UPI001FF58922|nr:GNAT family N-acetyltransferase [Ectobacillus sp. JY-23]UOY94321.1 N-acetyltransferase [Ectobacillus sp. JY-23]
MIHNKVYHAKTLKTPKGTLMIEGPVSPSNLELYQFHEDLTAFRPAPQQYKAVLEISKLPEARIIIARHQDLIVGYITYLHPDPLERWSEANMENLIELGAVEVVPAFRGFSVGKNMLQISMLDDYMEDYIIITTEYYWHWDLKGTGLNVWEYRKIMEKMMNAGGLEWMATDEPEICSHPANCLMVRIGKRVDQDSIQTFDKLRFKNRFMY